MAFEFVRASSQYISATSAPVAATPISFSMFVRPTNNTNNQNLITLVTDSGTIFGYVMALRGDVTNDPLRAQAFALGQFPADSAAYSINAWSNAAAIFPSSASRSIFLNAVKTTNSNTEAVATPPNSLQVGAYRGGNTFDGLAAEVALWSVALTDDEITSLSKGFKPSRIRPQSLVFYAPLIRNLQDIKAGLALTNNNSATVANHPRVY